MMPRYTPREPLGKGGQGSVFAAFDEELQRPVAIKLLSPEASTLQQGRLLREARVQARVRHPAIAEIFDKVRADSIWPEAKGEALILEYVPGESLDKRLGRGALAPSAAVAIARQLAEALAALHAAGYIHRDLKAGNVMLRPDGNVKLIDFGLVKGTSDDEPSLSMDGSIKGTLSAMSPEQARGEELDGRTDLFSLGTLIRHMVTGRVPFASENRNETLHRVRVEKLVPLESEVPDVPPLLVRLVERLHAKDLESRSRSAAEVARELARIEAECDIRKALEAPTENDSEAEPLSSSNAYAAYATPPTVPLAARGAARKWLGRSIVLLLLLAVAVLSLLLWKRTGLPATVVVPLPTPLEGPEKASWHGPAIRELLIAELAAGGKVRVIEDALVLGSLDPEPSTSTVRAAWLAKLEATHVVIASYHVAPGGTISVQARLVSIETGASLDSANLKVEEAEFFDVVTNAARAFRSHLGSPTIDVQSQVAAARAYPRQPEAARLYGEALLAVAHYDALRARPLLEAALEIEPDHPVLWSTLARTWKRLGYEQRARDAAKAAVAHAAELAEPERLRLELLEAELDRDWTRAVALARRAMEGEPGHLEAGLALAEVLYHAARWSELRDHALVLRRELRAARRDPRLDVLEAEARFQLGEDREAADMLRHVLARVGSDGGWSLLEARTQQLLGVVLRKQGELKGAEACWRRARELYERAGDRLRQAEIVELLAVLHKDRGEIEEAKQLLDVARSEFEAVGNRAAVVRVALNRGNLLLEQGRLEQAEVAFREAIAGFEVLGQVREGAVVWNSLGAYAHQRADWLVARDCYSRALDLFTRLAAATERAMVLTNLGEVDLATGDLDAALARLREAAALKEAAGLGSSLAYSQLRIAEVHWARGDATSAARVSDAAHELAAETEDAITGARVDLLRAEIHLARGELDRAAELATASEDVLRTEKHSSAPWAAALLAQIQLARGRGHEAGLLVGKVLGKTRGGDLMLDLRAEVTALRVRADLEPASREGSRGRLAELALRASSLSIPAVAWEARIAAAELAHTPRERQNAVRELADVERRARAAGFLQLAERAHRLTTSLRRPVNH